MCSFHKVIVLLFLCALISDTFGMETALKASTREQLIASFLHNSKEYEAYVQKYPADVLKLVARALIGDGSLRRFIQYRLAHSKPLYVAENQRNKLGNPLKALPDYANDSLLEIAEFNGTSTRLVTVEKVEPVIKLWDIDSQKMIVQLNGKCAHFNNDGSRFVLCHNAPTKGIEVHDAITGKHQLSIDYGASNHDYLMLAKFNSAGNLIVSCPIYGSIKIWDAFTGAYLFEICAGLNFARACKTEINFNESDNILIDLAALFEGCYLSDVSLWEELKRFERSCTLEQALLWNILYEMLILNALLRKRLKASGLLSDVCIKLDFNRFSHLEFHFRSFPSKIRVLLDNYVILQEAAINLLEIPNS